MGVGGFKDPPEGPRIGPSKDISEVPEDVRAELGDIEKLKAIAEPAKLDPRVAADEATAADEQPREPAVDPGAETSVMAHTRAEQGAEQLSALKTVLQEEQPEEDPLDEAAAPTDDDKREFIRCLLGDQPYVKEYELFNGMIKIRLRDLSPAQEDQLFAEMAIAQRNGKIETEDDWDLMLDRLRMVACSESLMWAGKEICGAFDPEKGLYVASENLLQSFKGATTYRALLRIVRVFRRHLQILMERAMDPDFWEVDGPDLQFAPISKEPSTTPDDRT
ncbi:hypothetical protein LCGC14_0950480 [marine sediment metagenome]|uniref:Uncharacterized protein n=1 Tax=marine sediment metagenome TaxID=412755 RepID=A0A0F9RNW2_9ZZZZ